MNIYPENPAPPEMQVIANRASYQLYQLLWAIHEAETGSNDDRGLAIFQGGLGALVLYITNSNMPDLAIKALVEREVASILSQVRAQRAAGAGQTGRC